MTSGVMLNCFEQQLIKNKHLPPEWKSHNVQDDFYNFLQANWEKRSVLFEDHNYSHRQQFLHFTEQGSIKTGHYIGTISFKGQQINIYPKVFREDRDDNDTSELDPNHLVKNIVQWLHYCSKIDYPFISIKSEFSDSSDLRDLFITIYLNYVRKALEFGPFYQYVDKTEDCNLVKGKINIKDYIYKKAPLGKGNKFLCTFSEFQIDNPVNRIIKYTCRALVNTTSSADNKKLIRLILIKLNEVSDVRCTPSDCDNICLSNLHRQYNLLINMSKMFLLNQTSNYTIDNHESFCFLFPTDKLFEGFIGGFIKDTLQEKAKVKLQASDMSLVNNVFYNGKSFGKAFKMKLDILVEHQDHGLFILDTKYKLLSRFSGNENVKKTVTDEVSSDDLYQIREYASMRGLHSAYLLYPMFRFEEKEPTDIVLQSTSDNGDEINIHLVRLPFVFEADIDHTKQQLQNAIMNIFV